MRPTNCPTQRRNRMRMSPKERLVEKMATAVMKFG